MEQNEIFPELCEIVPLGFETLKDRITCFEWDSVKKKLKFLVRETEDFLVWKWLSFIRNKSSDYQKSPFFTPETISLIVIFRDKNLEQLGKIRFINLQIRKHRCQLGATNSIWDGTANELFHSISLKYDELEFECGQKSENLA